MTRETEPMSADEMTAVNPRWRNPSRQGLSFWDVVLAVIVGNVIFMIGYFVLAGLGALAILGSLASSLQTGSIGWPGVEIPEVVKVPVPMKSRAQIEMEKQQLEQQRKERQQQAQQQKWDQQQRDKEAKAKAALVANCDFWTKQVQKDPSKQNQSYRDLACARAKGMFR